jgi:YggT family protein
LARGNPDFTDQRARSETMGGILTVIYYLLMIFQFILLARVLMTWIPNLDYSNPIVRLLISVTEPVLEPIRRLLPNTSGVDFSPLVVFLIIFVLLQILFR